MKMFLQFPALLLFAFASVAQAPISQDEAAAYTKTLNERTAKIVATLQILDTNKAQKVQAIIVQQYRDLNAVHDDKNNTQKDGQLQQLHNTYISQLSTLLTPQQLDKVKDGMTYNVLNVTYTAYQDMIPTLTEPQKNKIYTWLIEAREQAMDQGSSNEKHKVFGKYKGRINNYLSSEGYDLKKEEKDWQERLRKKREQNKG